MPHLQHDKDTGVLVPKPEPYKGQFVNTISDLYHQIRKLKPDYDSLDPRTWPCITPAQLDAANLGGPHPERMNPLGIAYNAACTEDLEKYYAMTHHIKSWTSHRKKGDLHMRFFHYPYNFGQEGELGIRVEIPEDDFKAWMEFVNGPDWAMAYPPLDRCEPAEVQELSKTPNETLDTLGHEHVPLLAKTSNETQKEEPQEKRLSPASGGQDPDQEIERLRAQLQQERGRAEKAEQEIRECKEQTRHYKDLVLRHLQERELEKARANEEKSRAEKLDEKYMRKCADVNKLRRQLAAGAEMNGGAKALKRKRADGDDDSGSNKKTKKTN